jgi:hypothetical protein
MFTRLSTELSRRAARAMTNYRRIQSDTLRAHLWESFESTPGSEHALLAVPVYEHLSWLTQSFRSSGRFIWPLLYCIELAVALSVVCALRQRRLLSYLGVKSSNQKNILSES